MHCHRFTDLSGRYPASLDSVHLASYPSPEDLSPESVYLVP